MNLESLGASGSLVIQSLNRLGWYDRYSEAAITFQHDLDVSGTADFLRPSLFATVDTTLPFKEYDQLQFAYLNLGFDASITLKRSDNPHKRSGETSDEETSLREWIYKRIEEKESEGHGTYAFQNILLTTGRFKNRWILIQGFALPHVDGNSDRVLEDPGTSRNDSGVNPNTNEKARKSAFLPTPLTDHQKFVENFDWASTHIGSMHQWPDQLLETCNLVLTNTEPAAVFWGKEMISIYNDAFIAIAGQKHPSLMGSSPMVGFAEVWDDFFEPRIVNSRRTKQPFAEENLCLMLERLGFPEETFVTFTFIPLLDHRGNVVGFYHTVQETTQQTLAQRRMTMLLTLSERTAIATDVKSYFGKMMDCISDNQLDVPFAVLYSQKDEMEVESERSGSSRTSRSSFVTKQCHFERSIGFDPLHSNLIDRFNLDSGTGGFASAFRLVNNTKKPVILHRSDGSLPANLMSGLEKRGVTDHCNTVVICPLQPTNNDRVLGYLAIGLSSARPYDRGYQVFVDLLTGQFQSSLASVVLFEEEKKRGVNAAIEAASRQQILLEALQEQARKNDLMEMKSQLLAERAPVGMFEFDPDGKLKFCNPAWYEMMRQMPAESSPLSWLESVHEEDVALAKEQWVAVSQRRQTCNFEFRLDSPWDGVGPCEDNGHGDSEHLMKLKYRWVLATAYPVLAEDDSLSEVAGTLTDISSQKWALAMSTQRVNDMIESKRQQENFVDMTSHEMRNPLNAMLLCAQDLYDSLTGLQSASTKSEHLRDAALETLANCIDSATTILYCGRHQKRIIDDILTLSKLDARLLEITPLEVDPIAIVREALKLFNSELQSLDIKLNLVVDETYEMSGIKTLLCDPSRVVQILVNFIANGIKFTQAQSIRKITITIRASAQPPSSEGTSLRFVPSGKLYRDPTTQSAWGSGVPAYLQFEVQDTGIGMSNEEMTMLFKRFSQNMPKSYVHYGGSGLGLFISRQLAELQGGQVGISSQKGSGTTFFFYVKTIVRSSISSNRNRTPEAFEGGISSKLPRISPPAASLASVTTRTSRVGISNVHILVVEDNLINQRVLCKQLLKLGYQVQIANHGEEALSVIYQSKFWHVNNSIGSELDIILMDIEMPIMDGRVCVRRIRELEQLGYITTHLPVIAVSANARQVQTIGAEEFGFDEVVSKPYNMSELVDRFENTLAKSAEA